MRATFISILFAFYWIASATSFLPTARRQQSFVRTWNVRRSASEDSFSMEELRKRIAAETSNAYADMFENYYSTNIKQRHEPHKPESVFIIAFQRGIHSVEYPKGSGNNVVLAFESKEACDKFAQDLRAQHFFDPAPQQIFIDDLDRVCQKLGAHVQVVPAGVELIPPQQRVKQLGKVNRSLREQQDHLNYVFDMMDSADFEDEGLLWSNSESITGIGAFE